MFTTPQTNYTPITSAAIYRGDFSPGIIARVAPPIDTSAADRPPIPQRGWVHPDRSTSSGRSSITSSIFEPKFKVLSARERKLMEINGCLDDVDFSQNTKPVAPRNLASLGSPTVERSSVGTSGSSNRRLQSPLIPTTMSWSCPNSPFVESTKPNIEARRQVSQLLPATMPWTAPFQPVFPSRQIYKEFRKQANDLLPATMPWTQEISSVTPGEKMGIKDFRRRCIVDSIPDDHLAVASGNFPRPNTVETDLRTVKIRGVKPDGNESSYVKRILTVAGVHVVAAKADIDILSNICNGSVSVTIRGYVTPEHLQRLLEPQGLTVVH